MRTSSIFQKCITPVFVLALIATQATAQSNAGLLERLNNNIDTARKKGEEKQVAAILPSPTTDISFATGETNLVLRAGLQWQVGDKGNLPNITAGFSDRIPKLFKNETYLLDYFSLSMQASVSTPTTLELTKLGLGYVLNKVLVNPATQLIGFQGFKNPSLSDLFSFSSVRGTASLNLVNIPTKKDRKSFGYLDWTLTGAYTPVKAPGLFDDVTGKLDDIVDKVTGLTNTLVGSVLNLTVADSIRRDIKHLGDIANSLTTLPQSLNLNSLSLGNIPRILDSAAGKLNVSTEKGKATYLFYTGPAVNVGSIIPNTGIFYINAYAQYLMALSKPAAHKDVYVLNGLSLLDSVVNYRRLLDELGIPISNKTDVTQTSNYYSNLLVWGVTLSCEFYAINAFVSYQGIKQLRRQGQYGVDYDASNNGLTSSFAFGVYVNLYKVFVKPKCTNP